MKRIQQNAFAGKRIRQNSAKLKQLRKRSRRLQKISLGVLDFAYGFNLAEYERNRKIVRETQKKETE